MLDSWVDTSTLENENSVYNVCNRGFQFVQQGRVFQTGTIKLKYKDFVKRKYEFILCKVGVGRAMPYTHPPKGGDENTPFPVEIPEGFDSLCVQRADADPSMNPLGMGAEDAPPEFQYEYYVLDPAQVLPQCLVQFEYNPADDQAEKIIICNQCEQKKATIYCEADDAYLCADCDEEIHNANKLMMKHKRRPIEEVC